MNRLLSSVFLLQIEFLFARLLSLLRTQVFAELKLSGSTPCDRKYSANLSARWHSCCNCSANSVGVSNFFPVYRR